MIDEFINRATILGYLDEDPVIKPRRDGKLLVCFTLVTVVSWHNRDGDVKRRYQYHRVAIFHDALAKLAKHLRKGCRVRAEGSIETRKWIGRDGQPDSFITEIILSNKHATLIVLDEPAAQTEASAGDDLADAPTPLSIKTSRARYDDADDSGLQRFLGEPDDHARAERRAAGEDDRRRA